MGLGFDMVVASAVIVIFIALTSKKLRYIICYVVTPFERGLDTPSTSFPLSSYDEIVICAVLAGPFPTRLLAVDHT